METRSSYRPWCDKASGKRFVKSITGECLHDYFYCIDARFCLCYEYARDAYEHGLEIDKSLGAKAFKFGLAGCIDAHTGLTADE